MLAAISAAYVDQELAREVLESQASIFRTLGFHGSQIVYFDQSPFSIEHRLFLKTRSLDDVDRLTQTPLSGLALEVYAIKTGDIDTVRNLLPDYSDHYAWLRDNRVVDSRFAHLPATIHPFESLDAQPATDLMYQRYLGSNAYFHVVALRTLLHAKNNRFRADAITRSGGFVMYDTCFLSFYIRSLFALGKLWDQCGDHRKSMYWRQQAELALSDFIEACFDPETGFFYNRRANRQKELLKVKTASGLLPLLVELPPAIVDALVQNLSDPAQFLTEDFYMPFVARNETAYYQESFEPLWRGPGSAVLDFMVALGLYENHREDLAEAIHAAQYLRFLHRLHLGYAFPEFYSPEKAFRAPYTWGALAVCNPRDFVSQDHPVAVI